MTSRSSTEGEADRLGHLVVARPREVEPQLLVAVVVLRETEVDRRAVAEGGLGHRQGVLEGVRRHGAQDVHGSEELVLDEVGGVVHRRARELGREVEGRAAGIDDRREGRPDDDLAADELRCEGGLGVGEDGDRRTTVDTGTVGILRGAAGAGSDELAHRGPDEGDRGVESAAGHRREVGAGAFEGTPHRTEERRRLELLVEGVLDVEGLEEVRAVLVVGRDGDLARVDAVGEGVDRRGEGDVRRVGVLRVLLDAEGSGGVGHGDGEVRLDGAAEGPLEDVIGGGRGAHRLLAHLLDERGDGDVTGLRQGEGLEVTGRDRQRDVAGDVEGQEAARGADLHR